MTEFAQEIPEGEDPFAGTDFGDWEQPASGATPPPADAAAELPVVDKEGNRVQLDAEGTVKNPIDPATGQAGPLEPASEGGLPGGQPSPLQQPEQEARSAEGAAYAAERAAQPRPEPTTPEPGATPEAQAAMDRLRAQREAAQAAPAPQAAAPAAQEPPAPAVEPPAAPEPEPESAPESAPPADNPLTGTPSPELATVLGPGPGTERDTFEDPTPPPASAGPTEGLPSDPTQSSSPPSPSEPATTSAVPTAIADAPAPTETRSDSGKTTRRKYVILRVTGPGKFEQVWWTVDDQGEMVDRGTPGAKRQTVALVRDVEEALATGFRACGSPPDGITLVAVAAAYFRAKPVRPKPPEPGRARLQIG